MNIENTSKMKTTGWWGMLMLFLCTFGLISCDDENEEGRKVTDYKEIVLTVASKKVPGILGDGHSHLTEVYAVKEEPSDEWSAFGYIDGFEFEPGYEYRIRISRTSYLDYSMGQPAWDEQKLLEVISKDKKDSEGLPLHLIPEAYYSRIPFPQYSYAVDAGQKEPVEQDLKENPLIPLDGHYMLYSREEGFQVLAVQDADHAYGPYQIRLEGKAPEEIPESYKSLPPEGVHIVSYAAWTFLGEEGDETERLSFDTFIGYGTRTRNVGPTPDVFLLYKDLTTHYQVKYPEAGVKSVVVAYKLSSIG